MYVLMGWGFGLLFSWFGEVGGGLVLFGCLVGLFYQVEVFSGVLFLPVLNFLLFLAPFSYLIQFAFNAKY